MCISRLQIISVLSAENLEDPFWCGIFGITHLHYGTNLAILDFAIMTFGKPCDLVFMAKFSIASIVVIVVLQ